MKNSKMGLENLQCNKIDTRSKLMIKEVFRFVVHITDTAENDFTLNFSDDFSI